MRPPPGRGLCAQLHGYSKAIFAIGARNPVKSRSSIAPSDRCVRPQAEENIVAAAIGRYIAGANPPAGSDPAALPKWRCDAHPRIIGKFLPAAPGRSAGRCRSYEPSGRVC